MDNRKTGALIASRRQELGWTQKELANRLNVSDRTVSKWERGAGFPDVSLLEPLADVLELSVLELLHGQRKSSEERLSPEAERSVREAARELGVRFWKILQRYRWALTVLAVFLVCGFAGLVYLWFSPFQTFVLETGEVSAAEALKVCPFAIITTDDFELSRQLLDDPNIGGLLVSVPSDSDMVTDEAIGHGSEISSEAADPYRALANIAGKPADYFHINVVGEAIYVDYYQDNRRCILAIYYDGSVSKTACTYKTVDELDFTDDVVGIIVDNQNNLRFTVSRRKRVLLDFAD